MNRILNEDFENILKEDLAWEKFKGAHVLITGASGMLGSYMTGVLLKLNEQKNYNMRITALVRHPGKLPEEFRDKVDVLLSKRY